MQCPTCGSKGMQRLAAIAQQEVGGYYGPVQTTLAHQLSAPPKPTLAMNLTRKQFERSKKNMPYIYLFFVLLALVITSQTHILCGIPFIIIAIWGFLSMGNFFSKKEAQLEEAENVLKKRMRLWEEKRKKWENMYYCASCHCVFEPERDEPLSVEGAHQFLRDY